MSESKTPRTDAEQFPADSTTGYEVVNASFARTLELELNEAASLFEEIENYAMTANQSVLEGKEPIRKEIFRDIRDMAKRGCNRDFQNNTWSELQKVKAQLTTAQQEKHQQQMQFCELYKLMPEIENQYPDRLYYHLANYLQRYHLQQQEIADLKRVVSYVAQFSKDSAMKGVGSK